MRDGTGQNQAYGERTAVAMLQTIYQRLRDGICLFPIWLCHLGANIFQTNTGRQSVLVLGFKCFIFLTCSSESLTPSASSWLSSTSRNSEFQRGVGAKQDELLRLFRTVTLLELELPLDSWVQFLLISFSWALFFTKWDSWDQEQFQTQVQGQAGI